MACVPDKAQAAACSEKLECPGDRCVDGYCCDTACDLGCDVCNADGKLGTCSPNKDGDAGVGCGLYLCDGTNAACPTGAACMADADCAANGYCDAEQKCQADKTQGGSCVSDSQCTGNQHCEDGVCCESACDGLCEACSTAKTGASNGSCKFVLVKTDPDNECGGSDECNGAGVCKKADGTMCNTGSDCVSGFCTDGFCCESACAGSCESCDQTGNLGKCVDVTSAMDGDTCDNNSASGSCMGGGSCSCDANGVCKGEQGASCAANAGCNNNTCVDGRCCESACNASCQSCANAMGQCNAVVNTTDADTCDADSFSGMATAAPARCDANGVCKGELGASCTAGTQCASGFCPSDGKCCDTACNTACESCATGTCVQITALNFDPGVCDVTNAAEGCGSAPCYCFAGACIALF
jgi:hypothetical protein